MTKSRPRLPGKSRSRSRLGLENFPRPRPETREEKNLSKNDNFRILQQHFSEISTNNEPVQSTSNSQVTQLQQNSLRDRLKLSLMQFTSNEPSTRNINENLKREFSWYERNKVKTPLLNQLYNALLSIQPTSTQSERNFFNQQ
ncbi:hypothetical protein ACKWTF_012564 [Chironomus riparius]